MRALAPLLASTQARVLGRVVALEADRHREQVLGVLLANAESARMYKDAGRRDAHMATIATAALRCLRAMSGHGRQQQAAGSEQGELLHCLECLGPSLFRRSLCYGAASSGSDVLHESEAFLRRLACKMFCVCTIGWVDTIRALGTLGRRILCNHSSVLHARSSLHAARSRAAAAALDLSDCLLACAAETASSLLARSACEIAALAGSLSPSRAFVEALGARVSDAVRNTAATGPGGGKKLLGKTVTGVGALLGVARGSDEAGPAACRAAFSCLLAGSVVRSVGAMGMGGHLGRVSGALVDAVEAGRSDMVRMWATHSLW